MKSLFFLLIAGCMACLALTRAGVQPGNNRHPSVLRGTVSRLAVLELFTSEGCISCPSADRLLPELAKLDSNIITLSYHVDYWDRLGWKDPFSSRDFSNRQKAYAKQFRLQNIYTPQLVVNGEYELVGNVRSKAELTIRKALAGEAQVTIHIQEPVLANGTIRFKTACTGNYDQTEIEAALVQHFAETIVHAGENSGARLTHTNIVRVLQKQTTAAENEFQLQLPDQLITSGWMLVVMTRQKKNLKITGASLFQPVH